MLVQIRRISVRSAFLVGLALYGIVGFLVGVVLAVVSTLATPAGTEPNLLDRMGIWVAVIAPVAYGLLAGFAAAVAAALYNAVAALVGGLRVEVPDLEPRWPVPTRDRGAGDGHAAAATAAVATAEGDSTE